MPLSALVDGPGSTTFESGLGPLLVGRGPRPPARVPPYIDYQGSLRPAEHLVGAVDLGPTRSTAADGPPTTPTRTSGHPRLHRRLRRRHDGDPRLGVVQLGLLGFWGEWHTWPHSDWFADAQLQSDVMAAYTDAFSTTLLQVRYASTTSAGLRLGYHDDSFAYSTVGDIDWFFVPQLERAGATERWAAVPIGGELRPELQTEVFEPDATTGPYQQDFWRCVEETHASFLLNYAAFGRGFDSAAEAERALEGARAQGYALHLAAADLGPQVLTLSIQNDGVAPFYHPLRVRVTDAAGGQVEAPLDAVLPGDAPHAIALDVSALEGPSVEAPWAISLQSAQVLPAQEIRFATDPGEGAIRVR